MDRSMAGGTAEIRRYGTVEENTLPGVPDRPVADVIFRNGEQKTVRLQRAHFHDRPDTYVTDLARSFEVGRDEVLPFARHLLYVVADYEDGATADRAERALAILEGREDADE